MRNLKKKEEEYVDSYFTEEELNEDGGRIKGFRI